MGAGEASYFSAGAICNPDGEWPRIPRPVSNDEFDVYYSKYLFVHERPFNPIYVT